jgi:hypothetical protein
METAFAQALQGLQTKQPGMSALIGGENAGPIRYSETPLIKSGEHNLKNIVVSVLSRQWPLSARNVYKEVCSENLGITYQGVHKALRQLCDQGVVLRTQEGHQLDRNWIDRLENYSCLLSSNYSVGKNTDFYGMPNGESACLEFGNYFQAVNTILEIMGREHKKPGKDEVLIELSHPLPLIGLSARTLEELKRHAKTHSFTATYHSDSSLDCALCRMWEQAGVRGRISRRRDAKGRFNFITKGILIQVMPSPQFARRVSSILSRGGHESLLEYTQACLDPTSKTLVTIIKGPSLADDIRTERKGTTGRLKTPDFQ